MNSTLLIGIIFIIFGGIFLNQSILEAYIKWQNDIRGVKTNVALLRKKAAFYRLINIMVVAMGIALLFVSFIS